MKVSDVGKNPERDEKAAADTFSISKLETFHRCPQRAFRKYVLNQPDQNAFFLRGRAVHSGQEWDAREKLEGRLPHTGQVLDASVGFLKAEQERSGIRVDTDRFVCEHRAQLEEYERSGLRGMIRPVPNTIEAGFEMELALQDQSPALITGFVDLLSYTEEADPNQAVVDYKTTQRPYTDKDVLDSLQMPLYMMGAKVGGARVVSFVAGKRQKPCVKSTSLIRLGEPMRRRLLDFLWRTITDYRAAYWDGDWPRCARQCFWCGPGICAYYGECYPAHNPGLAKLVQVGEIRPVGTLANPAWRR